MSHGEAIRQPALGCIIAGHQEEIQTRTDTTGGFDDPAHAEDTEEEVLSVFRTVRDKIKRVFEAYVAGYREN